MSDRTTSTLALGFTSTPAGAFGWARARGLPAGSPALPGAATPLGLAEIDATGSVGTPRSIAGGSGESVLQPEWSPSGVLHFASDRTGWWNVHRWDGTGVEPAHAAPAEYAAPHWVFGSRRFGFLGDGRPVAIP